MLTEVIKIIEDTFSPSIEITGETAIKNDLQLDSFEIINLICILEEKYKIAIGEMDIFSLVVVNDICNYIAEKTAR